MKFFALACCFLSIFGYSIPPNVTGVASPSNTIVNQAPNHDGKIESKYDGFTHETTITLKKMRVTCASTKGNWKDACISLSASLHCPGIQLDYVRQASLQLIFQTKDWDQRHALRQRDLSVVADGETYRLGTMRLASLSTDTLMTETLETIVPYATFEKMAKAAVVEIKVGPSQFELRQQNIIAFRDMINRVKV